MPWMVRADQLRRVTTRRGVVVIQVIGDSPMGPKSHNATEYTCCGNVAFHFTLAVSSSLPGEQRNAVLNAYIREDLLGLRLDSRACLLPLLSSDCVRKEALSRLLNALSSLAPGRSYLAANWDLLRSVFRAVQLERDDTPTRQNLTGVMQKLSLRRGPQSIMINLGVVSWLSRLLESSDSLSEYSLHYTLALLMNLSLRSKGRASCVALCPRLLSHLSRFLQLESAELRSYANGVLYRLS